jgi:hypothetical protein
LRTPKLTAIGLLQMKTDKGRSSHSNNVVSGGSAKPSGRALAGFQWCRQLLLPALKAGGVLLGCAVVSAVTTALFVWTLPRAAAFIGPVSLCAAFLVALLAIAQYQHVTSLPDEEHRNYREMHEVGGA